MRHNFTKVYVCDYIKDKFLHDRVGKFLGCEMTHTTTLIEISVYKGDLFSNVKKSASELLVARSWQTSDSYQNRVPPDKCHMTESRFKCTTHWVLRYQLLVFNWSQAQVHFFRGNSVCFLFMVKIELLQKDISQKISPELRFWRRLNEYSI